MTNNNELNERLQWEHSAGLEQALCSIRSEPPSAVAVDSFVQRAIAIDRERERAVKLSGNSSTVTARSMRGFGWGWSATLAASLLLMAVLAINLSTQRSAWAQVVAAATKHPWIRLTLVRPTDLPDNVPYEARTIWFNGQRTIAALQSISQTAWVNLTNGDQFELSPDKQRILAHKLAGYERQALKPLLEAIAPFDMNLNDSSLALITKQVGKTEVNVDGKTYVEFALAVSQATDSQKTIHVIVRVEKDTQQLVRISNEHASFQIDFPATGPNDIYALGVAQDTPLVDLRNLEKVFEYRKDTLHDDYEAQEIMVLGKLNGRWINEASRYYVSGNQLRYERAMMEQVMALARQTYFTKENVPTGVVHDVDWWMGEANKLDFEPVERNESDYPHMRCYAPIGSARMYDSITPSDLPGLVGTLELHSPKRSFWIDPARDGIVVRLELLRDDGTFVVTQYDSVIQDSQGRWFPTAWRIGTVPSRGQPLPSHGQPGGNAVVFYNAKIAFK